jgi:uncharacterized protein (DUF1015 family)
MKELSMYQEKESILELKKQIDEGEFELGFILYPSNINE